MTVWQECKLGELLLEKGYIRGPFGSSLKRDEMKLKGIPVYEQRNAIYNIRDFRFFIDELKLNELKRFQVKTNDLIVSCSGTVGRISIIQESDPKGIISQALLILRPDISRVTIDYLYYFLSSKQGFDLLTQVSHGSVQINIAERKVVETIPLSLPPLSTQKSIASILSSLDQKINLLHRENKTLESISKALFKQWFLENSQENWDVVKLKEVLDIGIGRTPPRVEHQWFSESENDVKWISIKDLGNDGVYIFKTSEYLTNEAVKIFNIPIIPKDTVILSFKMTVGRVAITTEEMLSNEAIAHFKFIDKTPFTKEYLFLFLKTFKWDLLGSTSSIVTAINSSMIKDMEITVPNNEVMNQFKEATQLYFEKIKINQLQIQTLTKLKNILLPKLMNGEVRIQND